MESNKLIAKFMELETPDGCYFEHLTQEGNKELTHHMLLQYHTSWDWLMPVVEKIECTTIDNDDNSDNFFNVMIEVFECNINGGEICICESGNTKREATYNAVVEFINEHNKNK
tara:strand:- start:155 stop:496 length:342 start_codon:yes stop_codon:yes gene_type:complete